MLVAGETTALTCCCGLGGQGMASLGLSSRAADEGPSVLFCFVF